jgi:hypothetical protein
VICGSDIRVRVRLPEKYGGSAKLEGRTWRAALTRSLMMLASSALHDLLNSFGLAVVLHRSGFLIFLVDVLIGDGSRRAFAGLCRC